MIYTRDLCYAARGGKVRCRRGALDQGVPPTLFEASAVAKAKEVIIETIKDQRGKYGRYLAEIWLPENDRFVNINDQLVAQGHAEYKEY